MSTRKAIRAYVVSRLGASLTSPPTLTYPTAAADRVYNARIIPVGDIVSMPLPVINVMTPKETIEDNFHVCTMEIELAVQGSNFATALDDLAAQIINRLDYTLGGNAFRCEYQGFDGSYFDEAAKPVGIGKLTYRVQYEYEEPLVDVDNLPDLEQIHMDWDMYSPNNGTVVGPDGVIDATDDLIFTPE